MAYNDNMQETPEVRAAREARERAATNEAQRISQEDYLRNLSDPEEGFKRAKETWEAASGAGDRQGADKAMQDAEFFREKYQQNRTVTPKQKPSSYLDYMLDAYLKTRPIEGKVEHGGSITGGAFSSESDSMVHPYLKPGFLKWLKEKQKSPEAADRMELELRKQYGGASQLEEKFDFLQHPSQRKSTMGEEKRYQDEMSRWSESQGY